MVCDTQPDPGFWTPAGMAPFGLLVHSKQICRGLSLQIGWGLSPITGDPRSHRGAALMWLLYSSRSLIFSGVVRTEIRVPWHANQHWLPLPPEGFPVL